jgi:DNA replication protein DnaC
VPPEIRFRRSHASARAFIAAIGPAYLSFNRSGAELLFQVFADRYERSSLLITSNLPFSEWQQVFQGERMTAALLDRLTHHCEIFEMNGESYRFRESMKQQRAAKGK